MRASFRPFFACVLVAGLAAACALDDPQNRFDEISFADSGTIGLDVGEVRVEQSYAAPGKGPNVDHRFPVQPKDAAERWAQDRLRAQGDRLVLRYIVRDAAVTETALETQSGVSGLLTEEQSERYDARIVVDLEIIDGRQVQATASTEVRRFVTVPEGISLKERERTWYELTENIMKDLDTQLEETIRTAFFPYIVL